MRGEVATLTRGAPRSMAGVDHFAHLDAGAQEVHVHAPIAVAVIDHDDDRQG